MPLFLPGDWMKHPKQKTLYRVVRVRSDGQIVVRHPSGQERVLTRPELYRKIAPPVSARGDTTRTGGTP